MFKNNTIWCRFIALLPHFECDSHTVAILTQWHLLPPLTSIVESSFSTHVHFSPLSLATRLCRCHANRSCYINNGWPFSGQTLYVHCLCLQVSLPLCVCLCVLCVCIHLFTRVHVCTPMCFFVEVCVFVFGHCICVNVHMCTCVCMYDFTAKWKAAKKESW